jgi:sulfide:quinone oxidoreductase
MSLNFTKVSEDFSSSPQLMPEDIPELVAQGYKTIINCRPDNEAAGQPAGAEIEAIARQHGVQYHHFPIAMGKDGAEYASQAAAAFANAPKPVVGYCRSGTRAAKLYQMASGMPQEKLSLVAWLKSKCLITRLWRWCKSKRGSCQCSTRK